MKTNPIVDLDQISINLKTAERIKKKINILYIFHLKIYLLFGIKNLNSIDHCSEDKDIIIDNFSKEKNFYLKEQNYQTFKDECHQEFLDILKFKSYRPLKDTYDLCHYIEFGPKIVVTDYANQYYKAIIPPIEHRLYARRGCFIGQRNIKDMLLKAIFRQIDSDIGFKIDDFDDKISYKNINNIKKYLRNDDKKSLLNIIYNTFMGSKNMSSLIRDFFDINSLIEKGSKIKDLLNLDDRMLKKINDSIINNYMDRYCKQIKNINVLGLAKIFHKLPQDEHLDFVKKFIYHDSIKNTEFKLQFAVIFYKLMSRDNRDEFISFLTKKADHSILSKLRFYNYHKDDKNTSCACI